MQEVPQIKAAYDWMIDAYEAEVPTARAAGNLDRLEEKRDILERGVFVMLFGQFESAVNDLFEIACDTRSANPDWPRRRGWDIPAYLDLKNRRRRVPFETKLALLLDRHDPARAKIMHAYGVRSHSAHGGSTEAIASIDQFVQDLYMWHGLLSR
ncbi:MAG: hypothetical protein ABSE69_06585 [Roseiarcus sp.]|jgi:hypothetical protein